MTITSSTSNKSILRALKWAGGREELAKLCRVTVKTVRNWERVGKVSGPSAHLLAIHVCAGRPKLAQETLEKRLRGDLR